MSDAIFIIIGAFAGAFFLWLYLKIGIACNTITKFSNENTYQKNHQPSDFPDKIEAGKKYYLSFLAVPGHRHRGFEICEVVGFEEYNGDPNYYPIIKEQNGRTYATCRMRLRNLTTDITLE